MQEGPGSQMRGRTDVGIPKVGGLGLLVHPIRLIGPVQDRYGSILGSNPGGVTPCPAGNGVSLCRHPCVNNKS